MDARGLGGARPLSVYTATPPPPPPRCANVNVPTCYEFLVAHNFFRFGHFSEKYFLEDMTVKHPSQVKFLKSNQILDHVTDQNYIAIIDSDNLKLSTIFERNCKP